MYTKMYRNSSSDLCNIVIMELNIYIKNNVIINVNQKKR